MSCLRLRLHSTAEWSSHPETVVSQRLKLLLSEPLRTAFVDPGPTASDLPQFLYLQKADNNTMPKGFYGDANRC